VEHVFAFTIVLHFLSSVFFFFLLFGPPLFFLATVASSHTLSFDTKKEMQNVAATSQPFFNVGMDEPNQNKKGMEQKTSVRIVIALLVSREA
jgi:hypothetical protein